MTSPYLLNLIRTEVEDYLREGVESHPIENADDDIYHLYEQRVISSSITVYLNNSLITNWTYDADDNTITLGSAVGHEVEDILIIKYNYYDNYSDTLLKEFIKTALNRIALYYKHYSIEDVVDGTFTIVNEEESGTPEASNGIYALTAVVSAILIKPDWQQYRALDLTITFKDKMSKDAKIQKVINDFRRDKIGKFDILETEDGDWY